MRSEPGLALLLPEEGVASRSEDAVVGERLGLSEANTNLGKLQSENESVISHKKCYGDSFIFDR